LIANKNCIIITKLGGKLADGPRKKPLKFGGNLDHITLELWLELVRVGYSWGLIAAKSHPSTLPMFYQACV